MYKLIDRKFNELYGPEKISAFLYQSNILKSKISHDNLKKYTYLNTPPQPFHITSFNQLNMKDPFEKENTKEQALLEN